MPDHRHADEPQLESLADVLGGVGERLRALRRRSGVTLDQLATATGISTSTLSRLESGQRRATLELLLPLARFHRVPLDDLVGAPPTGDPRIHPRPITRHGSTWVPLSRHAGGVSAFKQIIPVGPDPAPRPSQGSHEGYEWLYVLAGTLGLALGREDFTLRAGEAAEFDTRVPHGFANLGREPLELLILFGPQGERVHVRARATPKSAPHAL